ncbi:unnamed protein product [Ilex paraguariensis]|uniref:Uncharacterized protein n=1 Tax=Ilex paraguariensis TaxID=185542 RepID=A0ABC8UZC3_9AQUA
MDNSMISKNSALFSEGRSVDSTEESGWTFYLEDFLCDNHGHSPLSSGNESPSLVSDAGNSSVAKKLADNDQAVGFSLDKSCKNLSFKKRKTRRAAVDDALEDTASSPVNSPKVSYLVQSDMNKKENKDILQEKGNNCGQTEESIQSDNIGTDSDHTELKKRGLCLVPLSMLANYFG